MRPVLIVVLLLILGAGCDAFAIPPAAIGPPHASSHVDRRITGRGAVRAIMHSDIDLDRDGRDHPVVAVLDRRSALRRAMTKTIETTLTAASSSAMILAGIWGDDIAHAEDETMERGGVRLTPFNSLAFNYRGGESLTVDPSVLDEPSIPYSEFLDRLNADQVEYVEFIAPNGDAAYVTFKSTGGGDVIGGGGGIVPGKRIRIGEGYPIEDPKGWSSPAFVVKAVARRGVPYKFVVPGLGDSFR